MSWTVRLTTPAQLDIATVLDWTLENFGPTQYDLYKSLITQRLQDLTEGPSRHGVKVRDEILPGLLSFRLAQSGRSASHTILFRVAEEQEIEVLRVLHEAMDFEQHLGS